MTPSDDPNGTPIPEISAFIPEDADERTKEYMRAQMVIQAAFAAFGDRATKPGTATLPTHEVRDVLCVALAMMVAIDNSLKTPRDVRLELDRHAKFIRQYTKILNDAGAAPALQQALQMAFSQGAA